MTKLRISLLVLILPVIAQAAPTVVPGIRGVLDPMEFYENMFKKEAFDYLANTDPNFAEKLNLFLRSTRQYKNRVELFSFSVDIKKAIRKGDSLETIEEYIKKYLPPIIQTASDSSSQDSRQDRAYHGIMAKYLIHSQLNTLIKTGVEGIRDNKFLEEKTKKIVSLVSETVKMTIDSKKAQNSCQQSFRGLGFRGPRGRRYGLK